MRRLPAGPDPMQGTRHSILEAVRQRVSAAAAGGGADPAVIFDLDGTLFENTPRTQRILLAFALERGDEPLRQRVESVPVACYRYRIGDTLERLGVNGREREEIEGYWQRHFFSDRFLRFDTPLDGAPRYLRRLHAAGAHLIYLTGRDVPNMLAGTVESLAIHGFPIGQLGVELFLKPDPAMDDRVFKAEAARRLGRRRRVVAIFDNEPTQLLDLLSAMPGAIGILVEGLRAGEVSELGPAILRLASFSSEDGA